MDIERIMKQTVQDGDCLVWTGSLASSGSSPVGWDGEKMVSVRPIFSRLMGYPEKEGGKFWAPTCQTVGCLNHVEHRTAKEQLSIMSATPRSEKSEKIRREKISKARQSKLGVMGIKIIMGVNFDGTCKDAGKKVGLSPSTISKYRRNGLKGIGA